MALSTLARLPLLRELQSIITTLTGSPTLRDRMTAIRRALEIIAQLGGNGAAAGATATPAVSGQPPADSAPVGAPDAPTAAPAQPVTFSDASPAARFFEHDPNRKPSQRKRDNAAAVELLNQIRSGAIDGKSIDDGQKAILARYSGLGGNLISEGVKGSDYEYFTPAPLAAGTWGLLKEMGFAGGKVLDPCGGVGVFGATAPASAAVDAIELSETSGQINGLVNQRPGYNCTVSNFEAVAASTPDDVYDAVVANVPFGGKLARGENYRGDHKYQDETLEGYFILRALEKLKPGGLAAFICPPRVVSSKGGKEESVRFRASLMAEFMGAYRLPSHLFMSAGAETIVDLLVLRKHSRDTLEKVEALELTSASTLREANVLWGEFVDGGYFAGEGKRFVLGEFQAKDTTKFRDVDRVISTHSAADIGKLLRKFGGSRINWALLDSAEPEPIVYSEGDTITQAGQMLQMRGGVWEVVQRMGDSPTAVNLGAQLATPLQALSSGLVWSEVAAYVEHMRRMSQTGDMPSWLLRLSGGMARLKSDVERTRFWWPAVTSLAVADVRESTGRAGEPVNHLQDYPVLSAAMERNAADAGALPTAIGSEARDAARMLRIHYTRKGGFDAIWRGEVEQAAADTRSADQRFEAAKYAAGGQWVTLEQAAEAFGTDFDPIASPEWCVSADGAMVSKADDYFVGNLADMLLELRRQAEAAPDDATRGKLLAMMEEARRRVPRVDVSKMAYNLASPFVTLIERVNFLSSTYGDGFHINYDGEEPVIRYDEGRHSGESRRNDEHKLMKRLAYYVQEGTVTLQNTRFDGMNDRQALSALRRLAMEADEQFGVHCRASQAITERMDKQANDPAALSFPQTTDTAPISLPGWKLGVPPDGVTPHPYQYAEIRRRGRFFGGINGYAVGLGKSFTALACVQHAHNVGIKRRTAIVVPNSVLSNWQKEARVALENMDDCLFVGLRTDKKGKPKMDTGAYDADLVSIASRKFSKIFLTFEAFRRLRLRDETLDRYIRSLGEDDASLAVKTTEEGHINAKSREAVASRGGALSDAITKGHSGSAPYLEELGIDSLVVDEAHCFKNAVTLRDFKGAKFLSVSPASAQGSDSQAKAAYIRGLSPRKDGVLLLTATPVTNSPAEIYSMLSLAVGHDRVNAMAMGVKGPDQFMAAICDVQSEEDETIDGILRDTRVFRGLRNVGILRRAIGEVMTIETAETAGQVIQLPDADDRPTPVALPDPPTINKLQQYKAAYRYAVDKMAGMPDGEGPGTNRGSPEAFDAVQRRFNEPLELIGHPFNMIRKMSAAIMDPELDELATFYTVPAGDEALAEKVLTQFNALKITEERARRGPHTPQRAVVGEKIKKVEGDKVTLLQIQVGGVLESGRICLDTIDPAAQDKFEALAEKAGLALDVTVPPKLAAMLANFRKEEASPRGMNDDGKPSPIVKQIIFCDHLPMLNKIKRILSKHAGVSPAQIAIVTGKKNNEPEQIIAVQNGFNAHGEENLYRVIIANEKAEVGINLQRGTQAIHHLTVGWTPDSLTQRNGRGVRQGNKTTTVTVYHYDADGTFDAHKRRLVGHKAAWIDNVMDMQGKGSVEISGQMSAQQQEALMETVGDADAMLRFTESLEQKERATRQQGTRDRQSISIKAIESSRTWLKDNRVPADWAAKRLMELWGLKQSEQTLKAKVDGAKSEDKRVGAEKALQSLRTRMDKLRADINDGVDREPLGGGVRGGATPDADALIARADPSYSKKKPSLDDFRRQFYNSSSKGEKVGLVEGSALHADYAAEVANTQAVIEAAKDQFKAYSDMDGGIPARVVDLLAEGKGSIHNGVPLVDGTILFRGEAGSVRIVTNGGTATWNWQVTGRGGASTSAGGIDRDFDGLTIAYPGTPEYEVAAARAAAYEDDMVAKYPGADGRKFADMVPEIASRRRSVSLVPVENMMLPAPLFPVYISEFQARSSPILQEIRAEQAALVREIDGNGFVEPSVALADLPGGFSTAVALRERCEARGIKVPASVLLRFSNDRYGSLSFPVALKGAFVGADDIADALQPAKTIADAQQAARAWIVARHPSVEFSDVHLAKFSEILTPAQTAAFSARLQAIDMEEKAARADALNNGPDDEMVGITGNTFAHKDMIKELSLSVAGERAGMSGKGSAFQWNVRRKVWRSIVEKNPGLVERGVLVLTEYRGEGSASAVAAKQPEVAVRSGGTFPVKYRNPETGEMWIGRGLKPRWLINALDTGRELNDFLA